MSFHFNDSVRLEARGNTLTACKLLDDAMTRQRAYLFRDYLTDLIETLMENSAATSAYPRFSLGVSQRFASKAATSSASRGRRARS